MTFQALQDRFFREKPFPCRISQLPKLDEPNEPTWNFDEFDEFLGHMNDEPKPELL